MTHQDLRKPWALLKGAQWAGRGPGFESWASSLLSIHGSLGWCMEGFFHLILKSTKPYWAHLQHPPLPFSPALTLCQQTCLSGWVGPEAPPELLSALQHPLWACWRIMEVFSHKPLSLESQSYGPSVFLSEEAAAHSPPLSPDKAGLAPHFESVTLTCSSRLTKTTKPLPIVPAFSYQAPKLKGHPSPHCLVDSTESIFHLLFLRVLCRATLYIAAHACIFLPSPSVINGTTIWGRLCRNVHYS